MLLVVTLGFFLFPYFSFCESCEQTTSLSKFFNTCGGVKWTHSENWLNCSINICSWYGITCNSEDEIKIIRLRNNNIHCEIPEDIFYLPSLMMLDLSGNKGVSVDFERIDIEKAANISELHITDASVVSLKGINSTFSALHTLGVGGNSLTGEFPSHVLNLHELTSLDLSHNLLSGKIPNSLGEDLSKLTSLLVSFNLLTGTIPSSIGNLKNLSRIMLQSNSLTGTIPKEFNELSKITQVCLNDQTMSTESGLSGTLLDFPNALYLISIDVRNNILTGTVPSSLLQSLQPEYSRMTYVDISNNQLSGAVPAALSRFKLIRLHLFGNKIESIDNELCEVDGWFSGEIGLFGCDAIMCPPGTSNIFGRQISAIFPCKTCEPSRYYGATNCEVSIQGSSNNSRVVKIRNSISGNKNVSVGLAKIEPSENSKVVVSRNPVDTIFREIEEPTNTTNVPSIDWNLLSNVIELMTEKKEVEDGKHHGRVMMFKEVISSGGCPLVWYPVFMILSLYLLF